MSGYTLKINDDLDLDKIIDSGQCFRPHRTGSGTYRFISGSHLVDITDETYVSGDKEKKGWDRASVLSVSCSKKEWDSFWHRYFDLDNNYRKIRESIPDGDDFLRICAGAGRGIRILRQDRFEMLISFIISQRKSIPAIRTCIEKIVALYGHDGFFPAPSDMLGATADELSSCGLGYRAPYIQKAAERVALREVDLEALDMLSDEELFEELKSFAGVGDKVANCVELFAYHRTGRAPVDTWIKKVIEEKYAGRDPFPRYGRYAGIMQQYMFYYAKVHGL
ncbi:MAG: DNA-3-methyladenine glycosylase 2 [Lachnospiraceae bacterium]|nr:DNA-3-methyladenine glycosylase 2 [Lachnospiraceae bacterium]